jgi:ribosomal protein L37AE/L43A
VPVTGDEERRIERCPTCGLADYTYIDTDVVRCNNCSYLWVREPDPGQGPGEG